MSGSDNHSLKRNLSPTSADSVAKVPKPALSITIPSVYVRFEVGAEREEFDINRENACRHSPVLEAVLTGSEEKVSIRTYSCNSVPDVFRMLVTYLNGVKMEFPKYCSHADRLTAFGNDKSSVLRDDANLAGLWVLANHLEVTALQNIAVDRMVELQNLEGGRIPIETFSYIYKHTAPGSALRKLAVHSCCILAPHAFFAKPRLFPKELLLELVTFMSKSIEEGITKPESKIVASDFHSPTKKS